MRNDEYIRQFLSKHNFDGNIQVHSRFGTTWDDVVSITLNEKDLPHNIRIPIYDITVDVLSELPNDAFIEWYEYIYQNGYIGYSDWLSQHMYIPKIDKNPEFEIIKKQVDESIDKIFKDINDRYSMSNDDSDDIDDEED